MITQITLNINNSTRAAYRKSLFDIFVNEQPGSTGTVSEYHYFVETLSNGNRIYLKRPTALNKGIDFEVRVENTQFRYGKHNNIISTGNRPSHKDIYADLVNKKIENPIEFSQLKQLLDKTYNCSYIEDNVLTSFTFKSGHSVEVIFKSLKWLFIEQDITYWNRSGRAMLYDALTEIW